MSDDMWLEAYDEVMGEIEDDFPVQSVTEYLKELGPMPTEALVLGKCTDGLPLLLNLYDPKPLSVLMISQFDKAFLASVAVAIQSILDTKISYGVITDRPEQWTWADSSCVGVFSAYHRSAEDFILSAASWAHGNKSSKEVVIVLLDNFSNWHEQLEFEQRGRLQHRVVGLLLDQRTVSAHADIFAPNYIHVKIQIVSH